MATREGVLGREEGDHECLIPTNIGTYFGACKLHVRCAF